MSLTDRTCVACSPDAPTVINAEITELHREVPDWELLEVDRSKRLQRTFAFDDFAQALEFTNAVDLHRNDFIMAAKTDEVYAARSR